MSKKYGTLAGSLLSAIGEATGLFAWPMEYSDGWRRKQLSSYKSKKVYDSLYQLKASGFVRQISKNGKKFFELTQKGELETLFIKAHLENPRPDRWDGKWRLVIFDIPEDARDKRDKLRRLLKEKGFTKLQASVFINPFPLNRSAIDYLKISGLMNYIRFARIDELDDDKDLKKKFKLV